MLGETHVFPSVQGNNGRLASIEARVADNDLALPPPDLAADDTARGLQIAETPDATLEECVTLRSLLDVTSGLIAVVESQDHVFQFANSAWLKMIGGDVIGRTVQDVLPQADAQGLLALLDSIQARGHAGGERERHTIAIVPVGQAQPIHLDFVCRPVTGMYGALHGIVLEGADVTDRVLVDERQKLLVNELTHRAKNTSATVLGLARLARGSATDLDSFLTSLTDRVVAICKTQDLLTVGRTHFIPVREVLGLELQPYLDQDGDDLVNLVCQDLTLAEGSASSLSMIVHELLTNALKYGALSAAGGSLNISCEAVGQRALLTWSETTLNPISPIGKQGFGSRLIERLAQSLGGRFRFETRPDGLDIALTFKVEASVASL